MTYEMGGAVDRRRLLKGAALGVLGAAVAPRLATASEKASSAQNDLPPLPPSDPDPESPFGVDRAITVHNIDDYLNRPDVAYRDCRMLFDPADWWAMNGNPDLSSCLEGFRIVPYPYVGTMQPLPVEGAYDGDVLYTVVWNEDGTIESATPNFKESRTILDDLFPKDKPLFLVCGGGGYAGFTKSLLTFLGWDPALLYNIGGMWDYTGDRLVHIIEYGETEADDVYALWRADYATIDFSLLQPVEA